MRMGSHRRDGRRFVGGEADEGGNFPNYTVLCLLLDPSQFICQGKLLNQHFLIYIINVRGAGTDGMIQTKSHHHLWYFEATTSLSYT